MHINFCRDALFDYNQTWNTSNPNLSSCMRDTILTAFPGLVFLFLLPFHIRELHSRPAIIMSNEVAGKKLMWTKLALNLTLLANLCGDLFLRAENFGWKNLFFSDYFHWACHSVFICALSLIVIADKVKRVHITSPLCCLSWLCLSFCAAPACKFQVESIISKAVTWKEVLSVLTFWPVILAQLALTGWSDEDSGGGGDSPEDRASFLSLLFFSWMDQLFWKGLREPLMTQNNLPKHPDDLQVKKNVEVFMENWSRSKSEESGRVSIWSVILRTHGLDLLWISFLAFIFYSLSFANPQVLRYLIRSVDPEQESWKGVFFAFTLLACNMFGVVVYGAYRNNMNRVALRIRSALISMVFRKSLALSSKARRSHTAGQITNYVSIDCQRLVDSFAHINQMWVAPYLVMGSMYLLYQDLGVSSLAGVIVLVLLIPVNVVGSRKGKLLQETQLRSKDSRIRVLSETLNGIKAIKINGWEKVFMEKVDQHRSREVGVLRSMAKLWSLTNFSFACTPFMVTAVVLAIYVYLNPTHPLTAEKIFVAVSLFNIMRFPLVMFPWAVMDCAKMMVSVHRMGKFLNAEELNSSAQILPWGSGEALAITNGSFGWNKEEQDIGTLTGINMRVAQGSLIAIVGPVGSGKSSLLQAILGEMEHLAGGICRRQENIAYVSQIPWIQNLSLKENILFGKQLSKEKYEEILEASQLLTDLESFPNGDGTEIGENGINLSGGQKQRVALARAVYSEAELVLLDDPLSAVDVHVGRSLFDHVLSSEKGILRHKTRILVTNDLGYLDRMDYVYVMKEGRIVGPGAHHHLRAIIGSGGDETSNQDQLEQQLSEEQHQAHGRNHFSQAISKVRSALQKLPALASSYQPIAECDDVTDGESSERGRLTTDEHLEGGEVRMGVYSDYLQVVGHWRGAFLILLYIIGQGLHTSANVWLSIWADSNRNSTHLSPLYALGVYSAFGLAEVVTEISRELVLFLSCAAASKCIHDHMLNKVMRSPISFFEANPVGRILNRFSVDVDTVDQKIPYNVTDFMWCTCEVMAILLVICYSTPMFMIVVLPLGLFYVVVQKIYIRTSRQLKRLESISKSPIFSHFSEAVQGAEVIRAFQHQPRFVKDSEDKLEANVSCCYLSLTADRWLAVRMETLGNLVIFFSALFAVLSRDNLSAGLAGLSISYAMNVTASLKWMIRMMSELENNSVAMERIMELTRNPQEASWTVREKDAGLPPDWPKEGQLRFEDFETRYRDELDPVLQAVTLDIGAGQRVGICGRTGAGKSSLALGILRLIEATKGKIWIDGVNIAEIGLHKLRHGIAVIPQDPVFFTGSIRFNLDTTGDKTDEEIWTALEHVSMKTFVASLSQGLDHEVSERGENISVGQRQLLCLARALLRKAKVLILDEATASVDLETDQQIQKSIRSEFADCTVLTIAHRLDNISDCDRILVLSEGRIVETITPADFTE